MMNRFWWIILVGMGLLASVSVAVEPVVAVDFGADYSDSYINAFEVPVFSTVDADSDGKKDDRLLSIAFGTAYWPLDSDIVVIPEGKSGPGLKYGVSLANIDSDLDPVMNLNRFTPKDETVIYGWTNTVPGISRRMASAWYWEKINFLNGADQKKGLRFADEEDSLKLATNLAGTPAAGFMRGAAFLVQSDGRWYITKLTSAGYTTQWSINGAAADWYEFEPAKGTLFFDRSNPGPAVKGSSLMDITAFGMVAQHGLTSGTLYQGFKTMSAVLVAE
ncbi:hypothetical protein [Tichowtungia aerotolerans]|uniref:Uncharacterized protein n=1 Tax=Tichowtungia aerotolerans TaxID=2697043 RepID=A0A6P1M5Z6_9BACT|nr:hypothetical protein [Tichowtungia aerotolerans]QHI69287.1 hypothetical protein GT409_07435 [Tichowtungia aerotolerans]